MSITVVGSVAYDSIETPAGRRERCLGGAATYFSLAASFFTDVRVIAVVGEDFGRKQEAVFAARNIDTRGIEHTAGKSFFWEGSYLENINEAKTHNTELNVFATFEPKIPPRLSRIPNSFFSPTSIPFSSAAYARPCPVLSSLPATL